MKFFKAAGIIFCIVFISCTSPERPEFKHMKNVTARFTSPTEMILSGIAVYYNPNIVTGDLTAMDVNVWIDEVEVGQLNKELSVSVPGMDDFEVPFEFNFNPEKVFRQKGIFGSVISILEKKSVEVTYKGRMTMKVMNVEFVVPVDYKEQVVFN